MIGCHEWVCLDASGTGQKEPLQRDVAHLRGPGGLCAARQWRRSARGRRCRHRELGLPLGGPGPAARRRRRDVEGLPHARITKPITSCPHLQSWKYMQRPWTRTEHAGAALQGESTSVGEGERYAATPVLRQPGRVPPSAAAAAPSAPVLVLRRAGGSFRNWNAHPSLKVVRSEERLKVLLPRLQPLHHTQSRRDASDGHNSAERRVAMITQ